MKEELSESKKVYANFKAAAIENDMTRLEVAEIIISVYEASFKSKLSEDELFGVFLALEKMVTNKKTAIDVMADALCIKTSELKVKLEQKSNLSPDALSKFTDALEVRFKH